MPMPENDDESFAVGGVYFCFSLKVAPHVLSKTGKQQRKHNEYANIRPALKTANAIFGSGDPYKIPSAFPIAPPIRFAF